jgi:hypothetical protein
MSINISANAIWLCVRCGIESTIAEFRTMLKETTNDEPSTKATMTQNQCYRLFFHSFTI